MTQPRPSQNAIPPTSAWAAGVPRARAVCLLIAMTLSTFLFKVIEGLPYSLLRFMAGDLAVSEAQVGLLMTGYAIVVFLLSVPLAALTRRMPRRYLLVAVISTAALATIGTGFATTYSLVLVTRLITAVAQALFWVAVLPGTAGLFPPQVRGRILARLALGNALAPVIGLPTANWIAARMSWRTAFWGTAGLAILVLLLTLCLFPPLPAKEAGATPTPFASRRRFGFVVTETALLVAGAFAMITFVTAFMLDVAGFAQQRIPLLLMGLGLGGLAGAYLVAKIVDRSPWGALTYGALCLGVALLGLWAFGRYPGAAIVFVVLLGLGFGGMPPTLTQRALLCFPGSTEVSAGASTSAFNLGIAAGSAFGAALVASVGVRAVPLMGAMLVASTIALCLIERRWCGPEPVIGTPRS